jgi:protocatechuate 3,4-dioxygenase, beta subunit
MADPGYRDGYRREVADTHPPLAWPEYRSTVLRAPARPLVVLPHLLTEVTGPVFGESDVRASDADLTRQFDGEPQGERIIVFGRVLDQDGRPVPHTLVEMWQANASGRYRHDVDRHPAPLDPNFAGAGRCLTDAQGRYRFVTVKPGAYPWKNHHNAWRPAHIHFSLFGTDFTQRMITQMYFPGDPLFALDPIYQSITDQKARDRLVASYDHGVTTHEWATGYRWDVVLTGAARTFMETR